MANVRAQRIAGPILRKAYQPHQQGRGFITRLLEGRKPSGVAADLRAAFVGTDIHPAVIDEWLNEPWRRLGMAAAEAARGDIAKRRRTADRKRREAKAAHRKSLRKAGAALMRGIKKGTSAFVKRMAFRKAARAQ